MLAKVATISCLLVVLGATVALAQVTTATISGVVKDESGGILPGTSIVVTNMDTGIVRPEVTDGEGRYRVRDLAVGRYEVRGELQGFRTAIRRGIELTIGREAVVDLALAVGQLSEEVVVTGDAPLVDTTRGALSGQITSERIAELPIAGRDLTELVRLEIGVTRVFRGGDRPTGGFGKRMAVGGARPDMTGWLLDGTDTSTAYRSGPAGAAGIQLGMDAIQEVQVLSSSFSAEYGTVGGGVVNAITKSGQNIVHGSGFDFFRRSGLDQKNFFDTVKEEFKRDQFGFSAGGPIAKNKLFFFGAVELLYQTLSQTSHGTVLNQEARLGRLPGRAPVTVDPLIASWLALVPLPNGPDLGDGRGEYNVPTAVRTVDKYWTSRIDFTPTSKDAMYGRVTGGRADRTSQNAIKTSEYVTASNRLSGTLEETHTFSSRWLNKFRFGFNQASDRDIENALIDQSVMIMGAFPFPAGVSAPNVTMAGFAINRPVVLEPSALEFADDVSYARAKHNFKVGGLIRRVKFHQNVIFRAGGEYNFADIPSFLQGQTTAVRALLPGTVRDWDFRQGLYGAYVQDNWMVHPRLSVDLGVRYEMVTVPTEINGKVGGVRHASDQTWTVGQFIRNPSLKNISPRFSGAWQVTKDGRTSLRSGFGIFDDQIMMNHFSYFAANSPPFVIRGEVRNVNVSDAYRLIAAIDPTSLTLDLVSYDYDANQPKMMQFNTNIQRQLTDTLAVLVGFIGSRGSNLLVARDANSAVPVIQADGTKFFPANSTRRNPRWGGDRRQSTGGHSWYNAVAINVTKRLSSGYQFGASYTNSQTMDEGSGIIAAQLTGTYMAIDPDNRSRNRGLADFHVRHSFVVNGLWELPWLKEAAPVVRGLLAGWQFAGVMTLQTGTPITPQLSFNRSRNVTPTNLFEVPNLKAGASGSPVLGGTEKYFDPTVFELQPAGYIGNLGRNSLITPGVFLIDGSLVKNSRFALWGSNPQSIQVRLEFFNLLNRVNLGDPVTGSLIATDGTYNPIAGRIRTTSTPARQLQVGIRFVF